MNAYTLVESADEEPVTEKARDVHYETVDIEGITATEVVYTDAEEKALVRKLDFWILPILMNHLRPAVVRGVPGSHRNHAFQSAPYWILDSWCGEARQSLLARPSCLTLQTDLGLITVIGHDSAGNPITDSTRYSNCTWIFYIGYLGQSFREPQPQSHPR